MTNCFACLLTLLLFWSSPAMEGNAGFCESSLAAKTGELFQNGARYMLPADRTAVNAFNKSALADFRASGGTIVNTRTPQAFNGRFNPTTNTIELAPGRHLDTLTEELIHFRQAQEAGILGKGPFPGGPARWEADAMDRLMEMGFTPH